MRLPADPLFASTLPARTLAERPGVPRRRRLRAGPRDFGPYRIECSLGRGGMGEVFKAWDQRLQRHVALKLIIDDEPCRVERFRREAQAQARVGHPWVCQVYEVGELEGQHYIAMQYIAGETLGNALRRATLEQKLTVMKNVAEALHAAHSQGLVHRDVKPSNVMVEEVDGGAFKAYVLDFGLALEQTSQITTTFELMGTPQFMAPEQLNEEARPDRRTDIYALGATFYTVLAGRPPFTGKLGEVMRKVVEEEPAPLTAIDPALPPDVGTVLEKCLAKAPELRYETARALADDLGRLLTGEPLAARGPTFTYRLAKKTRKHRRLLSVAAILLTALATSLAWGWHGRWTAEEKTRLAQRFGRKVERIEALSRYSQMLPLHDTSGEAAKIRRLMSEIEAEMGVLGAPARGPGHYALGRGYFLLGDGEAARFHLEAAWNGGYRPPEAAHALGQTLGWLYQRELEELSSLPAGEERRRRRAAIEADLRAPALELLRQASGAVLDSPELLRAQLAYYSGRLQEALAAAEDALRESPWTYEAWVLKGFAYAETAHDLDRRGDGPAALTHYHLALAAFESALDVGRSHVGALQGVCGVRLHLARLEIRRGGERTNELLDQGVEACRRVLDADPRNPRAFDGLARLQYLRGSASSVLDEESPDPGKSGES